MIDARFVFLPRPDKLPMLKSSFGSSYAKTLKDLERAAAQAAIDRASGGAA
jgi:hypothetical protein